MYDLRGTMYDLESSRACARVWRLAAPMYDVRFGNSCALRRFFRIINVC